MLAIILLGSILSIGYKSTKIYKSLICLLFYEVLKLLFGAVDENRLRI